MNGSRITIGGVSCVLLALAVMGFDGAAARVTKPTAPSRPAIFIADVRSGPDKDLALWGRLSIRLSASGALSGAVVRSGGLRVPVTGTAHGRTLTLSFQLPAGTISGTGTARREIRTIADLPTRGTLSGPRVGDAGDWALMERRELAEAIKTERF